MLLVLDWSCDVSRKIIFVKGIGWCGWWDLNLYGLGFREFKFYVFIILLCLCYVVWLVGVGVVGKCLEGVGWVVEDFVVYQ